MILREAALKKCFILSEAMLFFHESSKNWLLFFQLPSMPYIDRPVDCDCMFKTSTLPYDFSIADILAILNYPYL